MGASTAPHRAHLYPGRPHRVYVRLSDDEWQRVTAAAAAAGMRPAGYLAHLALAAPDGPVVVDLQHVQALRELQHELFAARTALNRYAGNINQAAAIANTNGVVPAWAGDAVRLCARVVQRVDDATAAIHRRLRRRAGPST